MAEKSVELYDLVGSNTSHFMSINKDIKEFGKNLRNLSPIQLAARNIIAGNKVKPLQKVNNAKNSIMHKNNTFGGR